MAPATTPTRTTRRPLLPFFLVLLLAVAVLASGPTPPPPPASPSASPVARGSWGDRKACKRALQAVERRRRRAAKQAERERRPVVTLSYAQTLDGCLAWAGRQAAEISCPQALAMTHELRAAHDCILVGAGTMQQDNPRLNVRVPGPRCWWLLGRRRRRSRDPRPVLLVSALPLDTEIEEAPSVLSWIVGRHHPKAAQLPPLPFDPARMRLARPPIVFTPDLPQLIRRLGGQAAFGALRAQGWDFVECAAEEGKKGDPQEGVAAAAAAASLVGGSNPALATRGLRCDIADCLGLLRSQFGFRSLMVEGGARVLTACLRERVVDVACVTVAPAWMAPGAGFRAVQGPKLKQQQQQQAGAGPLRWLARLKGRDWEVLRVGSDAVLVGVLEQP